MSIEVFRLAQRKIALVFAVLAAFLAAAAPAAADMLDRIDRRGKILVGMSEFVPWAMRDKSGELAGFEVDVATRLAADLGVEAEFVVMPFNELIDSLRAKDIDIIISGMSITSERAKLVNFSNPYGAMGIGLAVNKKLTDGFGSVADLNAEGITLAVLAGTTSIDVAERIFPEATIERFENLDAAFDAVLNDGAHAVISDQPSPDFLALQNPDQVEVPIDKALVAGAQAFAVRKGDADFVNFLNSWIVARTADTWLPSTREYWFETLLWADRFEQ